MSLNSILCEEALYLLVPAVEVHPVYDVRYLCHDVLTVADRYPADDVALDLRDLEPQESNRLALSRSTEGLHGEAPLRPRLPLLERVDEFEPPMPRPLCRREYAGGRAIGIQRVRVMGGNRGLRTRLGSVDRHTIVALPF